LSENEQLKILDGLSTKNKKRIGEWLDTILDLLQDKLSKGELTGNKYFPYRKNKTFLRLPEFTFELTDNAVKTLERLKRYKHKLEQL
jgi:uncharacterized protein with von Willebrand factor type A (vWA) domain